MAPHITQHVIHVAEKFGYKAEDFNPHVADGDTLTWAIKCYFGWSERELYRTRERLSSGEQSGGDWNTTADSPDEGAQRRHPEHGHQAFSDGYWVSWDEYKDTTTHDAVLTEDAEQDS